MKLSIKNLKAILLLFDVGKILSIRLHRSINLNFVTGNWQVVPCMIQLSPKVEDYPDHIKTYLPSVPCITWNKKKMEFYISSLEV